MDKPALLNSVQLELAINEAKQEVFKYDRGNLYPRLLMQLKRELIIHVLQETEGNYRRAAQLLGLRAETLRKYRQQVL
ncbi:helix-turn-helix domain-containing protein [uncultured Thiothrix sp.]|uniref:helix-turn-helix domain-containing protein n=1 Tax=uncultured Thiothrix sp. TaxID=223185 RepID=UPI00260B384A|nr:helix-turn-helix domain-containing protein [uncultured Thiothrix sp.]